MHRTVFLFLAALVLTGCVSTQASQQVAKPKPSTGSAVPAPEGATRPREAAISAYKSVSRRLEPVAEKTCRGLHPSAPGTFCDFVISIDYDPRKPANAYQTIGRDKRPVITFNIQMLQSIQNNHEIAFILGHEAGHQIARHLVQKRTNAMIGAVVLGGLLGLAGADPQAGLDLGGAIGGRAYSKTFELQADRIGTHITERAGYNPTIGARSFARTSGSSSLLSTHPPSRQRYDTVVQTAAEIRLARSQGQTPKIVW